MNVYGPVTLKTILIRKKITILWYHVTSVDMCIYLSIILLYLVSFNLIYLLAI